MERIYDIKLKIAAGKLKEAIHCFLPIAQQAGGEKHNSAVMLSWRFNFYNDKYESGQMKIEEASLLFGKLISQLLKLLDDLPEC